MTTTSQRVSRALATAAIPALAVLALAGCSRPNADADLHLTYYHVPDCPVCEDIRVEVGKMPRSFSDRLQTRSVAVEGPEEVEEMTSFGFASHGMVVRSGDGAVLWKRGDDRLDLDEARVALIELIQGRHERPRRGGA